MQMACKLHKSLTDDDLTFYDSRTMDLVLFAQLCRKVGRKDGINIDIIMKATAVKLLIIHDFTIEMRQIAIHSISLLPTPSVFSHDFIEDFSVLHSTYPCGFPHCQCYTRH